MIRDRLKSVARKAAVRILGMSEEAEEIDKRRSARKPAAGPIDLSKVPKTFTGADDTPGPNHKEDIGRPFAAAQVVGDDSACFLDMRKPEDLAGGTIPRALVLPGEAVKQHLDRLPANREVRVTVYDQTGDDGSAELAQWLRENGWPWARRLRGGFAEWIEHGEPTARPEPPPGGTYKLGDPARLADGREGWIVDAGTTAGKATYRVWLASGEAVGPLAESDLRAS